MSKMLVRLSDDDPSAALILTRTDDGDIGITIMHKGNGAGATFCPQLHGGGASPNTWRALVALYEAVQLDMRESPQKGVDQAL